MLPLRWIPLRIHFMHLPEMICCNYKECLFFINIHVKKHHNFFKIGDVNVTNCAIGAVAGPGAQIGTASVVSKLYSTFTHPTKMKVCLMILLRIAVHLDKKRDRKV